MTTTPDRGARLAVRCREVGLEPVLLPCIQFTPATEHILESARRDAAEADWLVVTSSRAISALWPEGEMPPVDVAAVGSHTADAVRDAGGTATLVGEGGASDVMDLVAGRVNGLRVVFPHASGAGQSTVAALENAGATVIAPPVYETRPIAPAMKHVDAVAFGSPTSVRGWHISRDLDGLLTGAIGSTTVGALARYSVTPDVVPPRPAFDHLIRLIADHMRDRRAS